MITSILLKRAKYIRNEVLINGIQASHIDYYVDSISQAEEAIERWTKQLESNSPVITNLNRKRIDLAYKKLEENFDKLNETITEIMKDRPVLREKVCKIV